MDRITWEQLFMTLAYQVAMRSKDPSTHSGAVIVSGENVILSTGYNSLPRRIEVDGGGTRLSRENGEKYFWVEHAERNAIYNAVRNGVSLNGTTLYVNWMPCMDCARGIVQAGICSVIVHAEGQTAYESVRGRGNWEKDFERVKTLFSEAYVDLDMLSIDIPELSIRMAGKDFTSHDLNTTVISGNVYGQGV